MLKKSRLVTFILIMSVLLTACSGRLEERTWELEDISRAIDETGNFMIRMVPQPTVSSIGGEWTIIALARSDLDIPKDYFETYYENLESYLLDNGGVLHERKYTEYARVILALTAMGKDPEDVAGYNLLEALADYERVTFQGINGPTFALLALDSKDYEIPPLENGALQASRRMYIDYLLDSQLRDGGFSLGGMDSPADPDMTAMVIQALAKYKDKPDVAKAIDRGLDCLSSMQLESGGFESWGAENSESVVQVIMALIELGIDPYDSSFQKGGNSLIDNLMTFYSDGGGFVHVQEGQEGNGGGQPGQVDGMATDQGMYGLVAYKRYMEGKNSFYNMVDEE